MDEKYCYGHLWTIQFCPIHEFRACYVHSQVFLLGEDFEIDTANTEYIKNKNKGKKWKEKLTIAYKGYWALNGVVR